MNLFCFYWICSPNNWKISVLCNVIFFYKDMHVGSISNINMFVIQGPNWSGPYLPRPILPHQHFPEALFTGARFADRGVPSPLSGQISWLFKFSDKRFKNVQWPAFGFLSPCIAIGCDIWVKRQNNFHKVSWLIPCIYKISRLVACIVIRNKAAVSTQLMLL